MMKDKLRRSALLVSLVLAPAVVIAAAPNVAHAQQADAALETARKAFDKGQELFDKGDFKAASEAFLEAHAAKPFAAFIYNAAVCFEKMKEYPRAVELFKQYLAEDPKAQDREAVEKRIKAIEDAMKPQTDPSAPPPVVALPDAKPKGVVVITSEPTGATIYLDNKKDGPLGETPWAGSIEGTHNIIFELKGYQTYKQAIQPDPSKILQVQQGLAPEQYQGWLEVKSNIPGSDVYIDSKEIGAFGKTPWTGNVKAGKHKVWVSKEGYTEVEKDIDVTAGKPYDVTVKMDEAAVGYVRVRSNETGTGATVALDGKRVCEKAPCRFVSPEGAHTVSVSREGKKTLARGLNIVRKTETTMVVNLNPEPGRFWDVAVPVLIGLGIAGGGYYWSTLDPPDDHDPNKQSTNEKLYKYGPIACYGLAGVFGVYAIYMAFREKGAPSTATVDSRDLSWVVPAVGPGYAGVAARITF